MTYDDSNRRDQYRQDIWDSFPHLQKPEPQFDTPATREAFWAIWQAIAGAEPEVSRA